MGGGFSSVQRDVQHFEVGIGGQNDPPPDREEAVGDERTVNEKGVFCLCAVTRCHRQTSNLVTRDEYPRSPQALAPRRTYVGRRKPFMARPSKESEVSTVVTAEGPRRTTCWRPYLNGG